MKRKNKSWIFLACTCLLAFAIPPKNKIKVFMAGDSTMSVKEKKYYPETGWGMPFALFFDSSVTVINKAANGRSTRTFIEEGLWKSIMDNLAEGDYVFVQFGHNDEVPTKKSATTPAEFKNNLTRYVDDTRSKKATPILMTPMARRSFDSAGHIMGTHNAYAAITREVAKEKNVLMIDMDLKSQALLQKMGAENSMLLFNHLLPGEHPNYPKGKEDNTHFNELGARKMAELVLHEIRALNIGLAQRIYAAQ